LNFDKNMHIKLLINSIYSMFEVTMMASGPFLSLSVTPDGDTLVIARDNVLNPAELYSLVDGKLQHVFPGQPGKVNTIKFIGAGERILTGAGDSLQTGSGQAKGNQVRLWDVQSGEWVAAFVGHSAAVTEISVSADNRMFGTVGGRQAIVWRLFVSTQDLVEYIKSNVASCLSVEERERYSLRGEPPAWCITGSGRENEPISAEWRPKWPYDTAAWRNWLVSKRRGFDPPIPR
jgi:WD40 repeat protein